MNNRTNPTQAPAGQCVSAPIRLGLTVLIALLSGCATVQAPLKSDLAAADPQQQSCADWFQQLDATVDHAGTRDAGAYRIPGFPYLRLDRFSASFTAQAKRDPQAFGAWIARLEALDASARDDEIRNLPSRFFPIGDIDTPEAARARTRQCAARLAHVDLATASGRALLFDRARVPDNYSTWDRVLGLYAIMKYPFSAGVSEWHRAAREMFRKAGAGQAPDPGIRRYEPAAVPSAQRQIGAIFSKVRKDALGIPEFTPAQRELLFKAYAPAYEIATTGAYDLFGPLSWRGGPSPEVDTSHPTVYRRLAYTRFHGVVLTQLEYTIWFPERPSSGPLDLLAGRLDGVVFRVTLDANGAPLVYDTVHPCGCYHMFIPTARVRPLPAPEPGIEWAFIPKTLPALEAGARVAVRIASGTHYVVNVRPDDHAPALRYRLEPAEDLHALPAPDHTTRSAFGPDGLVPGTERGERFLFWPMGIASSGAMRQSDIRATAFIGRRHFDDADLIEKRFSLSSARASTPREANAQRP